MLASALIGVSGCAVRVHAPDVSAADRARCAAVVAALPKRVGDQARVAVDDPRQGAAWGDPEIVLRCGVGKPDGFNRASACQSTNGLDWFVPLDQMSSTPVDVTMTTIGRSPRIEITVPKDYWPPTAVMVDVQPAISAHTRKTGPCV